MSAKVELQAAYILHTRPYRDTSLLLDVLTADYGKVSLVAKGVKKAKNNQRYLLQPLQPLLLSWQGQHSLKTMIGVEASRAKYELVGARLYSTLYANELLTYLMVQDDPSSGIYYLYEQLLHALLDDSCELESSLRCFEFSLLEELGYGIDFSSEAEAGQSIEAEQSYYYIDDYGFVLTQHRPDVRSVSFQGADLQAMAMRDFALSSTRQSAKQLSRLAFKPHLRGRPLKSRELFRPLTT